MEHKIVTFGEVMMRLSAPSFQRFAQAKSFEAVYGGAEANVAVALSNFGISAEHVTRFPNNDLGLAAIQSLQTYGVKTDHILNGDGRLGLYFLEQGAMQRSPKIIYDRFDSAFSKIKPGSLDWDTILKDTTWFHWTGITPAISQNAATVCMEALQAAKKLRVTVSSDINYRRNLWQYGKKAIDIMLALIELTQIIVGGRTDFQNCLGIDDASFESGCAKVMKSYPNIKKIANTQRDTISASHNRISGMMWDGSKMYNSSTYDVTHIVDRVGTGDAFMAGLIYGWMTKMNEQDTIEFAVASGVLKHSIPGDTSNLSVAEVEQLLKGENIGKLLR